MLQLPPPPLPLTRRDYHMFESGKTNDACEMESVLIVDDNLVNQKILTKILRKHGYTTYAADHGEEALDILAKHNTRKGKGKEGSQIAIVLLDDQARNFML